MNFYIINAGILLVLGGLTCAQSAEQPAPWRIELLVGKETAIGKADLENLLLNRKTELFSEIPDARKFGLLDQLCNKLKSIPEGKDLQPLLLKEISTLKAINRPPVGWDEILILGRGGDVGVLMDCVISMSGEEGFNQIFDSLATADDPVKLKILLLQIAIRKERAKYDPILEMKLKTLQSPRLKEVIEAHLKTVATEK